MKLENKRMAQARRAAERERQIQMKKRKQMIRIGLGIIAVIAVIAVIIYDANANKTQSGAVSTDTEATVESVTESAAETGTGLNTEAGLVVASGDTVNLDYIGYVDGVEFNGGNTQGNGTDLTIGSGKYIDGFEDQIIGHSVGETFDITVTFPDGYGDTTTVDGDTVTLDNQEVVFTITLNGIYQ